MWILEFSAKEGWFGIWTVQRKFGPITKEIGVTSFFVGKKDLNKSKMNELLKISSSEISKEIVIHLSVSVC